MSGIALHKNALGHSCLVVGGCQGGRFPVFPHSLIERAQQLRQGCLFPGWDPDFALASTCVLSPNNSCVEHNMLSQAKMPAGGLC